MELKYRKLKCGTYKYETVGRFSIKTDLPDVKCNEYLSVKSGRMYIEDAYRWDGSSGPAIDTAKCMIASLVHDAYYQMMREQCIDRNCWRAYADRQYREICLDAGMWEFMAEWRYAAIVKYARKHTYPGNNKKYDDKKGKVYKIESANEKTTRKVVKAACILLATICLLSSLTGCMFVHVPGKGTVISMFKNIDADEIYIENDPNGVIWFVKYGSDAKNARLKYNFVTKTLEAAVEDGEKTEVSN